MNQDLYKQLVDLFNFITVPLWELYNGSYNGYQGAPYIGAVVLGLIASTYPSQISYHVSALSYTANQMIVKAKWWSIPLAFFVGKLVAVYLLVILRMVTEDDRVDVFLEELIKWSGPLYLVLGLWFIVYVYLGDIRNKRKPLSIYLGMVISFVLSLFTDPGVILIMNVFEPWIVDRQYMLGWIVPFVYVLATFTPILVFCFLAYGFQLDTVLGKNANRKAIRYFFGLVLIVLAVNQFFLYW